MQTILNKLEGATGGGNPMELVRCQIKQEGGIISLRVEEVQLTPSTSPCRNHHSPVSGGGD